MQLLISVAIASKLCLTDNASLFDAVRFSISGNVICSRIKYYYTGMHLS